MGVCVPSTASVVLLICPKMIRPENNYFGELSSEPVLCIKIRQRLTVPGIAKRSDNSDKLREISNVSPKDVVLRKVQKSALSLIAFGPKTSCWRTGQMDTRQSWKLLFFGTQPSSTQRFACTRRSLNFDQLCHPC